MQLKIDSRGRITIPLDIRETLGFDDIAFLEIDNNKIIITKDYDPIRMIDNMLDNIHKCEMKLECIDVLYEAKKQLNDLKKER